MCKISDIVCAPPIWTVLVRWYPHCAVMLEYNKIKPSNANPFSLVSIQHKDKLYSADRLLWVSSKQRLSDFKRQMLKESLAWLVADNEQLHPPTAIE